MKEIPIILTIGSGRYELVEQTLRTLFENTKYPHKLYIAGSDMGAHQHVVIRNKIIHSLKDWEFVVSIDDDNYFSEGWLEHLIETHKKYPDVNVLEATRNDSLHDIEEREDIFMIKKLCGPCCSIRKSVMDKIGYIPVRRLWTRGMNERLLGKGLARLKNDKLVVHCGLVSYGNQRYSKEFTDHVKGLAEQVGAIT